MKSLQVVASGVGLSLCRATCWGQRNTPLCSSPLRARQHWAACVHRRRVLVLHVRLQAVEQQRHAWPRQTGEQSLGGKEHRAQTLAQSHALWTATCMSIMQRQRCLSKAFHELPISTLKFGCARFCIVDQFLTLPGLHCYVTLCTLRKRAKSRRHRLVCPL